MLFNFAVEVKMKIKIYVYNKYERKTQKKARKFMILVQLGANMENNSLCCKMQLRER